MNDLQRFGGGGGVKNWTSIQDFSSFFFHFGFYSKMYLFSPIQQMKSQKLLEESGREGCNDVS